MGPARLSDGGVLQSHRSRVHLRQPASDQSQPRDVSEVDRRECREKRTKISSQPRDRVCYSKTGHTTLFIMSSFVTAHVTSISSCDALIDFYVPCFTFIKPLFFVTQHLCRIKVFLYCSLFFTLSHMASYDSVHSFSQHQVFHDSFTFLLCILCSHRLI